MVAYSLPGRTISDEIVSGIIETDATAITFTDIGTALKAAQRLYQGAFDQTRANRKRRYWLRGCIIPQNTTSPLRRDTRFKGQLNRINITLYEPDLFDAIAVEKSGIKGMRLLVDRSLITREVNEAFKLPVEKLWFIPFKKFQKCNYPGILADNYVDFCWMASADPAVRAERDMTMSLRLREAAIDAEEFAQAAATQVTFFECAAIIGSITTRFEYQRKKSQGAR